jgi:hypothetical protein
MNIQFMNISGNTAWVVGQVTSVTPTGGYNQCCVVGHWVFYKVRGNGNPGVGVDLIWGEDITQGEGITDSASAAAKVSNMATPLGGPFTINSGDIQVH